MLACSADALEAAVFERAQELRLGALRHLADLVEEDGPFGGDLEEPWFGFLRVGERALFIAEQLGLDEVFGERRAVDLHKRVVLARPLRVDGLRDEIFAGPGLPVNQHGGRRNLLKAPQLFEHLRHRGRCPNEFRRRSGLLRTSARAGHWLGRSRTGHQ